MKNYAILIGSSRFEKEPKLTPLRCPENDVDGMRDMLTSAEFGLFAAEDLLIFKNRNHYDILPAINDVFSQAEPTDLILLYYSGHGELDKKDRLHLATLDTQKRIIETTSIPTERLRRLIDNHRCKRVVLILDCCFSGSVEKDFLNRSTANSEIERLSKGIYILTASTASQAAEEKKGDKYGLLTRHILEGIQTGQAATNQDGLISVDAIYHYVSRQVPKSGAQDPMRYDLQVQGDSLFIARAVKAYSETQLRAFKKKINELDNDDALPDDIIKQAREIISANQQKRDKALFDLLHRLCEKNLGLWPFQHMWLAQIGQSSLPSTPTAGEPKPSPPPQKTEPALKVEAKPDRLVLAKSLTEDLNGVSLELIAVPGGKFWMGSEAGREDEKPVHQVTVTAFAMGKYEVTQAQWQAVMGSNPSNFKGDDLPVERVSWEDAQAFCEKLRAITGKAYRLPSEAEWEYACRAGQPRRSRLVIRYPQSRRISMAIIPTAERRRVCTVGKQCGWGVSHRMRGGCTICTAMFGNGVRMFGTRITTVRRTMVPCGRAVETQNAGCCGAVRGSTMVANAAPLIVSESRPIRATSISVFVLLRRRELSSPLLFCSLFFCARSA